MQDICKEAPISPGALYVYFDSKEALIAGIAERDRAGVRRALRPARRRRPISWRRCRSSASSISSRSRAHKRTHVHRDRARVRRAIPRVGEIFRSVDRFVPRASRSCSSALQDEGRIAPALDIPTAAKLSRDRRRHVLAPRGRSGFRCRGADAGRPAAHRRSCSTRRAPAPGRQNDKAASEPAPMKRIVIGSSSGRSRCGGLPCARTLARQLAYAGHADAPCRARARSTGSRTSADSPPAVSVVKVDAADFVETVLVYRLACGARRDPGRARGRGPARARALADEGDRVKKGDVLARPRARHARRPAGAERRRRWRAPTPRSPRPKSQIVASRSHAWPRPKRLRAGQAAEASPATSPRAPTTSARPRPSSARGPARRRARRAEARGGREGPGRGAAARAAVAARPTREVTAPADGLVSRRTARIGGMRRGRSASRCSASSPRGEIELDAEVTETRAGQDQRRARRPTIEVAGVGDVDGTVRLVSPEVDKTTRLGRVRIFLGDDPTLRIGAFARGTDRDRARRTASRVPASAVVLRRRAVRSCRSCATAASHAATSRPGSSAAAASRCDEGLDEGDLVVAKAGTFLRDGDAVRAVMPDRQDQRGAPDECA